MVRRRSLRFPTMALAIIALSLFTIPGIAAEVPRITKEELKSMLEDPDVIVLDVRGAKQREASGRKIKGAVWEDYKNVESWAENYPIDKTLVLY